MVEKLTPEFIDTKNLLEHQDKFFEKIYSFKEKINNKIYLDDIIEILDYYEWYSMRFEVWAKYNLYIKKINKPKKWSKEWLLLLKDERIIKSSLTKFINYINYKYGDMCEFCEDYECCLSSCIFCAKFGCMKCVECYADKNFGSCFNCNIKQYD